MLCFLGIGFVGAIVSACVVAAIYGDDTLDIGAFVIIALFIAMMPLSLLFLIPFRKAVFSGNDIILKEYGTPESRTKTYELYYSGFEIVRDNTVNINAKIIYGFSYHIPRISKMIFSPLGFKTNGLVSFEWSEVDKVEIEAGEKQIAIFTKGEEVQLPLQKNILYLIKTFYPKDIENEYATKFKSKKEMVLGE